MVAGYTYPETLRIELRLHRRADHVTKERAENMLFTTAHL